jgi:hypothetical protein
MASPRSKKERRKHRAGSESVPDFGPIIGELIEPYLEQARASIEREMSESGSGPDPESWENIVHNLTLLATGAISLVLIPESDVPRLSKKMIRTLPREVRRLALSTLKEMIARVRIMLDQA